MITTGFMTTAEVAKLIGRTPRTVARMAANGQLQPLHKGNGIRGPLLFDPETVEELAEGEAR